jgi:hypothetical protein
MRFHCDGCGRRFEAEGTRQEWTSSIYGPCYEYRASCPGCGEPAKEYRAKPNKSEETDFEGSGSEEGGCENGPCAEGPCGAGPCDLAPPTL